MNRRDALKTLSFLPLVFNKLLANSFKIKNYFSLTINGDLDDDLIILKSTPDKTVISNIFQMHNSKGEFFYEGKIYPIKNNPGYIKFNEKYKIDNNELYIVCLANEMEDANMKIDHRIRTHYKNENLLFNDMVFLKHLMPEYNSVPNYPVWFNEGDISNGNKIDINGNTYNYYNLFENTTVQIGIIFPKKDNIKIFLFNQNNELVYTFNETISSKPKYIKSDEVKLGLLQEHPFVEIGNILHTNINQQIENKYYIIRMLIEYKNQIYNIKFPYPAMYPNLISTISVD